MTVAAATATRTSNTNACILASTAVRLSLVRTRSLRPATAGGRRRDNRANRRCRITANGAAPYRHRSCAVGHRREATTATRTWHQFGWAPTHPGLLEDIATGYYDG